MKWLLFLALLFSSCSLGKQVVGYRKVEVYGLPPNATTKLPQYLDHVLASYYLFTIDNEQEFLSDLYTCLHALPLSERNGDPTEIESIHENVRVVFKIQDKNHD